MKDIKFAIVGAGCGGQSMAAILADGGYVVKLQDINSDTVNNLKKLDKITLTGKYNISAKPELITLNVLEAIEDVDFIMVVTTADAHENVAKEIANFIKPNQIVILNPGFIGGSLSFKNALKKNGCIHDIIVGETTDLVYTCRKIETGLIHHSGLKKEVGISTVPANRTSQLIKKLKPMFSMLIEEESVLHAGFKNDGFILHSIPMILNINKIDKRQSFDYYMEGITPSIARLAEKIDLERIAIAREFGFDVPSIKKSISDAYGIKGDNLYEVIQANKAYVGINSPISLNHRFLVEDTCCSLIPLASIAKELNISTPGMDAIIEIINIVTGKNFYEIGRTASKIGFAGKSIKEIYKMII